MTVCIYVPYVFVLAYTNEKVKFSATNCAYERPHGYFVFTDSLLVEAEAILIYATKR